MKFDRAVYKRLRVTPQATDYKFVDYTRTPKSDLVTFRKATSKPFHRWFYYKQGFSPGLVDWIAHRYPPTRAGIFLDPCVGTGTSILDARDLGYASYGIDIAPHCAFVSRVKSETRYDLEDLVRVRDEILRRDPPTSQPTWPDVPITDGIFSTDVLDMLIRYRDFVRSLDVSRNTRDFFLLALLAILPKVGHFKRDGAMLRRTEAEQPVSVRKSFADQVQLMLVDLKTYLPILRKSETPDPAVFEGDARRLAKYVGTSRRLAFSVFSPPYSNGYDYTRIYSPELAYMFVRNNQELIELRKRCIRSNFEASDGGLVVMHSATFGETMERIRDADAEGLTSNPRVVSLVEGYNMDLATILDQMTSISAHGCRVAVALGNSRWGGVMVENDVILAEEAEARGWHVDEIGVYKLRGTSAQQTRKFGETQVRESVVVVSRG